MCEAKTIKGKNVKGKKLQANKVGGFSLSLFLIEVDKKTMYIFTHMWYSPRGSAVKSACQCRGKRRGGFDPWSKIPQEEKKIATHSNFLAWEIP